MAGLSGLVHEKCPAAPRQAEDGARGQELGPASLHRTPTLMALGARDVLSIYDLGGKFQSSCGAGLVCDCRQEACHRVCMSPLVSVVSIVMSHVLRQDNMKTGRGVTHHQHQAAARRRGPGNWEKVIFRNCNRRLRVPLIFFHLYLQQTNLQLQKVIGVKVCDVEIFLAPLHSDMVVGIIFLILL